MIDLYAGYEEGKEPDGTIAASDRTQELLAELIRTYDITVINPPRPGKRLLVLDIDFTIFDCRSQSPTIDVLKRPYLAR